MRWYVAAALILGAVTLLWSQGNVGAAFGNFVIYLVVFAIVDALVASFRGGRRGTKKSMERPTTGEPPPTA